ADERRDVTGRREQPAGPGRPRDPAADAAILRAALELLVERGVEHAGIEAIAKRAGVAKVTVYRRWSSKADILADAIESAREEIPDTDGIDSAAALPDLIEELLPRWSELLAEPRFQTLAARLLGAGPEHPKLLRAWKEHHLRPRRVRALALLSRARDAGLLSNDADLELLIDIMNGAIMQYLLLGPESPTAQQVEVFLRRLFRQVGLLPSG
ncbi:MAG: TetR/AcrR family transcriptional regulator, partial [Stackebrandtia sp.]